MELRDSTIFLSVDPREYDLAKSGKKMNVSESPSDDEWDTIYHSPVKINLLNLQNKHTGDTFIRELTNVHRNYFNTKNGDTIDFLTFSWDKNYYTQEEDKKRETQTWHMDV